MESNLWFTTQHTRYHRPTYHTSLLSVPRFVFCVTGLLLYLLIFIIHDTTASRWQQGVVPIFRVDLSQLSDVKNFKPLGQTNNFKAIYVHGDNLLVGSQNALFNLSLPDLKELKRLEWRTSERDRSTCSIKTASQTRCENFIRVITVTKDNSLFICGTHGLKPKCREYESRPDGYSSLREISGEAMCPVDPDQNSTAIMIENHLYAATPTDRAGAMYSISRLPLQTRQSDRNQLYEPNFVSSLPHGEHIYFFFRENAVEFSDCGKIIYSRVARVCSNDEGHSLFTDLWTSFHKARLDCSIPGKIPFQFNELQSTSQMIRGVYNGRANEVIYGIFTTPDNSLPASAVCAYRMSDVQSLFEEGSFLDFENPGYSAEQTSKVPAPRPGKCVKNSSTLSPQRVVFARDHPLMYQPITPLWSRPVVVQTDPSYRFFKIAIDPQVETVQGNRFDIIFIGTTDGRLLKVINSASNAGNGHQHYNQVIPEIIDETLVFPNKPIINLQVHRTHDSAKLIVVSDDEIVTIPVTNCESRANSCGKCVALKDPYCAWDAPRSLCTNFHIRGGYRDNFVQNVEEGWDSRCPDGRPSPRPPDEAIKDPTKSEHTSSAGVPETCTGQFFAAETLAFAVVTSIVSSLVLGFILGYIFSRRCKKEDPMIYSHYGDQRLCVDTRRGPPPNSKTYGGIGPPTLNKPINLVLNVPPKIGKNANSSADNKPIQKVNKIYL
ncbi:semaphorin-1A-like isoform X2 [Brevipalpus obovatus]|uniref:semaphorin-1A-like isoform X2 n=1 Tax=Brevipalpus obovatus TaxID=246614 RepID=UPI003D9F0EB0